MFFDNKQNFDELLTHLPETDKKPFLDRFLIIELANSWLRESGIKYEAKDVIDLVKTIVGK
jgi:hypothetical protein